MSFGRILKHTQNYVGNFYYEVSESLMGLSDLSNLRKCKKVYTTINLKNAKNLIKYTKKVDINKVKCTTIKKKTTTKSIQEFSPSLDA